MRALVERRFPVTHVVAATAMALFAATACAHPHVWINYESVAHMHGTVLDAVQEKWTFAEGFPVAIVGDMTGMPKTGPAGPKYTEMFKEQAFSSLKGVTYFTHVFVDGKPARFGEAQNFSVAMVDGHIVYTFLLPLAGKVDVKHSNVQLGIWDETFFVDFQAPANKGPVVSFDPAAPQTCNAQSFEDHDHPIFGGNIFPLSVRLSC
jgi:ABC-type uncharacterized transport system substrate-binding protein